MLKWTKNRDYLLNNIAAYIKNVGCEGGEKIDGDPTTMRGNMVMAIYKINSDILKRRREEGKKNDDNDHDNITSKEYWNNPIRRADKIVHIEDPLRLW